MLVLFALLPAALAGDLWLEVSSPNDETFGLDIPGSWLLDVSDPIPVRSEGVEIDLRDVAREVRHKRLGAKRTLRCDDADGTPLDVTVSHHRSRDRRIAVDTISLDASDDTGLSLHLEIPIGGETGAANLRLAGAGFNLAASLGSFTIPWNDAGFFEQLRHAPPRTLASVKGPEGTVITVQSR